MVVYNIKKSNKVLLVMRMPKTGSRSLRSIVRREYGSENIVSGWKIMKGKKPGTLKMKTDKRWDIVKNMIMKRGLEENTKAVVSHMFYGWHEYIERECTYITFVREPVSRYLSFYNHVKNMEEHPFGKYIRRNNLSVDEVVKCDEYLANFNKNLQVKIISGNQTPNQESLFRAIDSIKQKFAHVGKTQSFDEDILKISQKFGWNLPFYRRKNVSKNKTRVSDLSVSQVKQIAENNILDIALFRYLSENNIFNSENVSSIKKYVYERLNISVSSIYSIVK